MRESERVDEIAPIIAGVARLGAGALRAAGSAVKSYAKKKAMEKAKEKLIGKKKDPQVDQAIEQEMEEAVHTAYFNFAVSLLESFTMNRLKDPGPKPKMTIDPKTGKLVPKRKTGPTTLTPGKDRPEPDADAVRRNQQTEAPFPNSIDPKVVANVRKYKKQSPPTTPQAGIGGVPTSVAAGDQRGGEGPERRQRDRKSDEDIEKIKRGLYRGKYRRQITGYKNNPKTGKREAEYEKRFSAIKRAEIEKLKDSPGSLLGKGFSAGRIAARSKRQRICLNG